ncbi:MAG: hypothetical protein HY327_09415 [Chloroflexi bacterium]|nr:hypothetical protein [Chloroflexota bacterium]
MDTLALRPNLIDPLKNEAARRKTSVEALANDWLEEQLWEAKRKKINEEAERFRAQHAKLLEKHAGEYVAMRDGVVIDHDLDLLTLHQRVRNQYGDEPILMAPVTSSPVQSFKVIGTRRRGAQQ